MGVFASSTQQIIKIGTAAISKLTNKSKLCPKHYNKRFALIVALIAICSAQGGHSMQITPLTKDNSAEAYNAVQHDNSRTFTARVSGQGQAVLLIPGLMSSGQVYGELAEQLSQDYEVHVLSVKGFAGVPKGPSFSLNSFKKDIIGYIKTNQLAHPHIVGHSMGGLSALLLASEHEKTIGSVVSIDGLPFIGPIFTRTNDTTVGMLMPQAQSIKHMFANMNAEQLAAQAEQGVFIQATAAEDRKAIIEMAKTSDPETSANAMFDVMTTDLRSALTKTNTPILMLGASGAFTTEAQHKQVAQLYQAQFEGVPSAKVIMNSDIRHFMMLDDMDWVLTQVTTFLGSK